MALINQPPQEAVDNNGDSVRQGWATFFSAVFNLLVALTLSGSTTDRPIRFLWVGRPYFDTTVGRPIWYVGPGWVYSDGTPA